MKVYAKKRFFLEEHTEKRICMFCETVEETNIFLQFLHDNGRKLEDETEYISVKNIIKDLPFKFAFVFFNDGTVSINEIDVNGTTILSFRNYRLEWYETEYKRNEEQEISQKSTYVSIEKRKPCSTSNSTTIHTAILQELSTMYAKKNADYGDSFHKTFLEEGLTMSRIRLSDKLERFKRLTKTGNQEVKDESIRDTLLDLANYAIMTVMELEDKKELC